MTKGKESHQTNFNTEAEALDEILKAKADAERLEQWKKEIPLPSRNPVSKGMIMISLLVIGMLIIAILFFLKKTETPKQMAQNYIDATSLNLIDDVKTRGETYDKSHENLLKLQRGVSLAKGDMDKTFDSILLFTELIEDEGRYQLEALWYRALAHVKTGNNALAENDLRKLAGMSNYQKEETQEILNKLKQN